MDFNQTAASSRRRLLSLSAVALLHVVLVYALVSGMAHEAIAILRAPLETRIVEEVKPPPPPPPERAPPPRLNVPPPPFIPPPEVSVQQPAPAISAVSHERPPVSAPMAPMAPPVPAAPARKPVVTEAVIEARLCKKPEYPPQSVRERQEGRVTLMLLVGVDGKVMDSYVQKSSGHAALDAAARAALSLCQFKPGTVDGVAQQSWTDLEYNWRLY